MSAAASTVIARPAADTGRFVQIDALRGLAALAVVLFHYTTRFTELYAPDSPASWAFPYGHFGVNLFFIVSGFVIFMTLERVARPMDFVVSRFSRLFPAYWAAVLVTFAVVAVGGLPGKEVNGLAALANLTMIHGLFKVPHVDGVYWTLEVELLFYGFMLLLYQLGRLGRIHQVLWALLALRMLYFVLARFWGIDLPWIAFRLLILQYLPWFALGICMYQLALNRTPTHSRAPLWTIAAALGVLFIAQGLVEGLLGACLSALVYGAARGRVALLGSAVLVWLGAISYPLYLLHENIGWVVQRQLLARGLPMDWAVLMVLALSLVLATALTRTIEQPAMHAIRGWYRRRRAAARPA